MNIGKKKLLSAALGLSMALSLLPAGPVLADNTDFTDVAEDAWYAEEVAWAVGSEITSGVGDGRFDPLGEVSRAQLVTFLWRMAGKPAPEAAESFSDVATGAWYETPVQWAVSEGITRGTGDGMFSPDETCSRAMCLTMLYRMIGSPLDEAAKAAPVEMTEDSTLEDLGILMVQQMIELFRDPTLFPDVAEGAYYELPVVWGGMSGILTDDNTGKMEAGVTFRPEDPCIRAEMISFLFQTKLAQDAAEAPLSYEYGDITLMIPREYDDLLYREVFALGDGEEGILVTISERASREAAEAMGQDPQGAGELFSIGRVSEAEAKKIHDEDIGYAEVFAKGEDGLYYIFYHPTDVRLTRESNEEMTAAMELWSALNEWARTSVCKDIIANSEGLTAFSFDEAAE